jgi:hypothetical protein
MRIKTATKSDGHRSQDLLIGHIIDRFSEELTVRDAKDQLSNHSFW